MEYEMFYVLVVDDEEDLCWVIRKALRPAGFAVKSANSGRQALAYLAKNNYKVAFVDVKISDMDGFTLATLIHQHSPCTSIILISGYYYQEDKNIVEGLKNNLFSFIAKPFDLDDIRRLTRQAVESTNIG
ncbi:MAG: response regulator [Pelolinea sp.]|nr:response regulator [Pelolinea sp.]